MLRRTYLKNRDKFELRYIEEQEDINKESFVVIDNLRKGIQNFQLFFAIYTADRILVQLKVGNIIEDSSRIWNSPYTKKHGTQIRILVDSSSKVDLWKHWYKERHKEYGGPIHKSK